MPYKNLKVQLNEALLAEIYADIKALDSKLNKLKLTYSSSRIGALIQSVKMESKQMMRSNEIEAPVLKTAALNEAEATPALNNISEDEALTSPGNSEVEDEVQRT